MRTFFIVLSSIMLFLMGCSNSNDLQLGEEIVQAPNITKQKKDITITLAKITYFNLDNPDYITLEFMIKNNNVLPLVIHGSGDPERNNIILSDNKHNYPLTGYGGGGLNEKPDLSDPDFSFKLPGQIFSKYNFTFDLGDLPDVDFEELICKIPIMLGEEKLEYHFQIPPPNLK